MSIEVIYYPNGTTQTVVHQDPPKPEFRTLYGDEFMGMCVAILGIDRLDQLLSKSKTIENLLLRATKVDRNAGKLPTALQKLMQGVNALTQAELDQLDAAWRLK